MNIAILMGRMARDPELRYTSGGKAYTNFTLAVQKTKDEAEFIDCVAWEKAAENIAEYFRKGNRILINGKIITSTYESNGEKRKSVKVQAFSFEFIDSKNSGNNQNSNRNNYDDDENEGFPFWQEWEMTVREVIEIQNIMKILNKIGYCKKHSDKKTKDFVLSIEKQYIEKSLLSEKQLQALEKIYINIIESNELEEDWRYYD